MFGIASFVGGLGFMPPFLLLCAHFFLRVRMQTARQGAIEFLDARVDRVRGIWGAPRRPFSSAKF